MRIDVWRGTAARAESLSLELIRMDNECEILLQSSVRGLIGGRKADPSGAVEAFSKQLVTCCCESIDWVWWWEAESSAASRRAFPSVNRPPVLPIWRKNEAPAAPQFPLSAGGSCSRLQPSRLQHTDIYSVRLFSGLIVFNDAWQLSQDLFYEAEWDVGWSALLARAALQSFQWFNFISLRKFSVFIHCTDPLEHHGSKSITRYYTVIVEGIQKGNILVKVIILEIYIRDVPDPNLSLLIMSISVDQSPVEYLY